MSAKKTLQKLYPWLLAFAVVSPAMQHLCPFIQRVPIVKIAFALAWITALVAFRGQITGWLKSKSSTLIALFGLAVWLLLSTLWSASPKESFIQWMRLAASASTIGLFAVFATRTDAFRKAGSLVFYSGVVVALLAIFQVAMTLAGHPVWVVKADGSFAYHFTSLQIPRATAGFFHPNNLGLFLLCCLTWLLVSRNKDKIGLGEKIGIALLFAGAFCSGSKTAMGLMLLIILYVIMQSKLENLKSIRGITFCIAGLAVLFCLVPAMMSGAHSVKNIRPYPLPSNLQRALLWDAAARQTAQHPLLGVGFGISASEITRGRTCALPMISGKKDQLPHNFLVQAMVEGGFVAVVLAAMVFAGILLSAQRKSAIALFIAMAWLVAASLHNLAYQKPFWIAVGVIAVAGWQQNGGERKLSFLFDSNQSKKLIGMILTCLVIGILAIVFFQKSNGAKGTAIQSCSTLELQGPENQSFEAIHQFGLALLSQNETASQYFNQWPLLQIKGLQTPTMQIITYNDLNYTVADVRAFDRQQGMEAANALAGIVRKANRDERLTKKGLSIKLQPGIQKNIPNESGVLFYILWVLAAATGVFALLLQNNLKDGRNREKKEN